jgi:hypothetical protein
MKRSAWRVLAKALGEKAHPADDRLADRVASLRVGILLAYMVTNAFICAGVIRHWNDAYLISHHGHHDCHTDPRHTGGGKAGGQNGPREQPG